MGRRRGRRRENSIVLGLVAATGVQDLGGGGLMWGMTWRLRGLIFAVAWGRPQGCAAPRVDSVHEDNEKLYF